MPEQDNGHRGGRFRKGHIPWNRGLKGLRRKRERDETLFRRGQHSANWMPVGTVTIRIKNGRKCAWVKIAEPSLWKPRAYVVWEEAGGPELSKGLFLYHLDGDPLNDDLTNLAAVTRAFQLVLLRKHHPGFGEKRRLAQRKARWGW